MSDTPETDEYWFRSYGGINRAMPPPPDFARMMERQRNEIRAIADKLADVVGDTLNGAGAGWRKRASEALAAYHVFTKAHMRSQHPTFAKP